jgi:hypothetical protein
MASKEELEAAIKAIWLDLRETEQELSKDEQPTERQIGYLQAVTHARDLVGIAVKSYRIPIR